MSANAKHGWAAAPTFPLAWTACGYMRREVKHYARQGLAAARVVAMPPEQIDVLPVSESLAEDRVHRASVRLPFEPTYLDFGAGVRDGPTGFALRGALCWTNPDGEDVLDLGVVTGRHPRPVWLWNDLDGFLSSDDPFEGSYDALAELREGLVGVERYPALAERAAVAEAGIEDSQAALRASSAELIGALSGWAFVRVTAALRFLEAANVELVEAVDGARRRKAERKGQQIALTVVIRQPRRSVPRNGPQANYSYRFEVRGHYAHYPPGTQMADSAPEKLCEVPGRGLVRRIWVPPHVKGPTDKPLIPKRRVLPEDVSTNITQRKDGAP